MCTCEQTSQDISTIVEISPLGSWLLSVTENAGCAPALFTQGERAMQKRRRFKQSTSLKDRLATFAQKMREKASKLAPGREKDDLLQKARQAETDSHLDDWANSRGLRPPR